MPLPISGQMPSTAGLSALQSTSVANADHAARPSVASPAAASAPAPLTASRHAPRSDVPTAVREAQVASAMRKSAEPPRAQVASDKVKAQVALNGAAESLRAARNAGVDIAKKTFWTKCFTVAAQAIVVGVAVALTVATGGAAAVALLAIAGVSMAITACDAVYAHRCVRSAQDIAAGGAGNPPPGGASAVRNLVHWMAKGLGASDETAGKVAKYVNWAVQGGLAVAAFAVGAGLSELAQAPKVALLASKSLNASVSLVVVAVRGFTEGGQLVPEALSPGLYSVEKATDAFPEIPSTGDGFSHLNEAANLAYLARQLDSAVLGEEDASPGEAGSVKAELRAITKAEASPGTTQRLLGRSLDDLGDARVALVQALAGVAGIVKALA